MTYTTKYSNGNTETHETLAEALNSLRADHPEMVTCDNDPDRLLVWENEANAGGDDGNGDDGSNAVAEIRYPVED